MVHEAWRRLHTNWATWFTGAVVLWFLASGLGLHLPSTDTSDADSDRTTEARSNSSGSGTTGGTDEVAATTTSTTTTKPIGPLDFRVVSFRLAGDRKHPESLDAELTIEVRNTASGNTSFQPDQLRLRRMGSGGLITAGGVPEGATKVSARSPLILPVTFPVTATPGGTYELTYFGHVVYTGKPF